MRFDDLLALSFIDGIGEKTLKKLNTVECLADLFLMDDKELASYFPTKKTIELFRTQFDYHREKMQLARKKLHEDGAMIITPENSIYPERLYSASNHPFFLYCMGNLDLINHPKTAAIAGPRLASENGLSMAYNTARALADRDVVIVSGLAKGIDSAAHRGAVDNGKTIAVLPYYAPVYPPENQSLCEKILKQGGLVIAENYEPYNVKYQLLSRDKIIIGLADRLYIPDAYRSDSGTSYTVDHARKCKKTVYVYCNDKYVKLREES